MRFLVIVHPKSTPLLLTTAVCTLKVGTDSRRADIFTVPGLDPSRHVDILLGNNAVVLDKFQSIQGVEKSRKARDYCGTCKTKILIFYIYIYPCTKSLVLRLLVLYIV